MSNAFHFTKIVIIESLESSESKTGEYLYQFLLNYLAQLGISIPIEFFDCDNIFEYQEIMDRLLKETAQGEIPILHIESHGDSKDGLIFRNGSEISWENIYQQLVNLNIASKFNLIAIFLHATSLPTAGASATMSAGPAHIESYIIL